MIGLLKHPSTEMCFYPAPFTQVPGDLLPDFSTTLNLVESVFLAGDGSEKAFYGRTVPGSKNQNSWEGKMRTQVFYLPLVHCFLLQHIHAGGS